MFLAGVSFTVMHIAFLPPGKPFALWSRELPPAAPAHPGSGWGPLGAAFPGGLQTETVLWPQRLQLGLCPAADLFVNLGSPIGKMRGARQATM